MADDKKKFGIEIGTSADTSGLEKTEQAFRDNEAAAKDAVAATNPMTDGSQAAALDRQKEAQEASAAAAREGAAASREAAGATDDLAAAAAAEMEAQRAADVQRAQVLKSQREQAESLKQLETATKRLMALQLALEVNRIAQEFKGASPELDAFLGGMNAMATGLATGNPFVAIAGAALDAAVNIKKANDAAKALVDEGLKNVATATANYQRTLADLNLESRRTFLKDYFTQGRKEIDLAFSALERFEKLQAAVTRGDTSDRETAQAQAARGGADPKSLERADIRGDFQAALAEINARVTAAESRADLATQRAQQLEADAALTEANDAMTQADVDQAKQQAAAARDAAEAASLDAELAAQTAIEETRVLLNTFSERFAAAQQAVNQDAAARAQEIVTAVETDGAQLSDVQKLALERLKVALSDQQLTATEQQQAVSDLRTVLTAFKGSIDQQRELNSAFLAVVTDMNGNTQAINADVQRMKREVEDFKRLLSTQQSAR